jgi:uncharacterized protein (TIGR02246 family)
MARKEQIMRTLIPVLGIAALMVAGGLAAVAQQKEPASPEAPATVPGVQASKPIAQPEGEKAQPEGESARPQQEKARPEDEKAIRRLVGKFVAAYNAHDAAAIAALFTPDAMIEGEDGKVAAGPKAIAEVFVETFKAHPQTRIENAIESIHFAGLSEAIEDGRTTVVHDGSTPPEKSRYRVVHVKRGGQWLMASATDLPEDIWTGEEPLKQLEGLVGDWIDESPTALVITSSHWTDNHRFLLSHFTVQIGGRPAMTGSQRIGWDPLRKTIRSWAFDSEGGFNEGTWTRKGNQWIIKTSGVTRDGKPASATNIITLLNKDRRTWQSRDRVVGGQALADMEEIPIVRKPPEPK